MVTTVTRRTVAARPPVLVAEGVHLLTLGRGIAAVNVHLVGSATSWVLVDTGWPGQAGAIRGAAEAVFGPGARPVAILLTHLHPDHSGSVRELARHWAVPVWVLAGELPQAAGGIRADRANPLDRRIVGPIMRMLPAAARRRVHAGSDLSDVVRGLDPDAVVPGLEGWTLVPTPGHTPGHVALHRPRDGVVITGDAVLTVDLNSIAGVLGLRSRPGGPPWLTTWDRAAAIRSVAALAALHPTVLAPGHGAPLTAGTAGALGELAERLRDRARALEGFGRPVDYTADTAYRRPPAPYRRLQPLGWLLTRLGLSPGYAVVLEVPGRRTGLVRRTTLVRVELGGRHYLVSLAGEAEWVRNVRAAGGRVVLGRRERRAATLVEVPPDERPAVIRAYLHRPGIGGRTGLRVVEAVHFFGVGTDPSDDALRRAADRYPVFRVDPPVRCAVDVAPPGRPAPADPGVTVTPGPPPPSRGRRPRPARPGRGRPRRR
jgi:deazaflavin-dependent oxidoreductase (nitroreductase family)